MFKLCVLLFAFLSSACATAHGEAFHATAKRTVYLTGEVGPQALPLAAQIVQMAAADTTRPVDIVINSPGGSIYAGVQIMSAMEVVQARGVKIRCFVPVLAASMAFQILAACDERYTLPFSLLLWHPGRLSSSEGMTAGDLEYNGEQLRAIERELNQRLIKALGISKKLFYYHYHNETLWFALELNRTAPGFITIVNDFSEVRDPFSM